MKLADYEKLWFESLNQNIDNSKKLGIPSDRLNLYQDFVRNHYIGALEKMFPRIEEVLSPNWVEWSKQYYEMYPPLHFELNSLTLNFSNFIKGLVDKGDLPEYIIELAEYELGEFFIYTSPENYYQEITNEESLWINKASKIFEFQYRIGEWVKAMDESLMARESKPEKVSNILAITRDNNSFLCVMSSLNEIDVILVELLRRSVLKVDELIEEFYSIDDNLKQFDQNLLKQRIDFLKLQKIIL
ncbi:putative DNA-binding domain-containing protein [Bacteriovoracaceae bacterium]|nr:putative DNA-binding domain-containing protein [Bacteriovoracaceae bacterium]